jgi:hypothetical protein
MVEEVQMQLSEKGWMYLVREERLPFGGFDNASKPDVLADFRAQLACEQNDADHRTSLFEMVEYT